MKNLFLKELLFYQLNRKFIVAKAKIILILHNLNLYFIRHANRCNHNNIHKNIPMKIYEQSSQNGQPRPSMFALIKTFR